MAKAKWKEIIDINISLMSNRELLNTVYEAATTCGADEQEASARDFYFFERATDILEERLIRCGFLAAMDRPSFSDYNTFQYSEPCWLDVNITRTVLENLSKHKASKPKPSIWERLEND